MQLEILAPTIDDKATVALRACKLVARNDGTFASAVVSAGFYAQKTGRKAFVYRGNAYGTEVFRVTFEASVCCNRTANCGLVVYTVEWDLTVSRHEVDPASMRGGT